MNADFTRYVEGVPVKDRTPKLAARTWPYETQWQEPEALLNERAAKAQRGTPSR